jgi:hypothetical protein
MSFTSAQLVIGASDQNPTFASFNVPTLTGTTSVGYKAAGTAGSIVLNSSGIVYEGSVADANTTVLAVTNPTAARTITFPDATGTVALLSTIGIVASSGLSYNSGTGLFGTAFTTSVTGTGYGSITYNSSTGNFAFTAVTDANIRGAISVAASTCLTYSSSTGIIGISLSATNSGTGLGSISYSASTGVINFTTISNTSLFGVLSVAANSGLTYNNATGVFGTSLAASTSGTGFGSLAYSNGTYTYSVVTAQNIRDQHTVASGSGLTYNSSTGQFGTSAIPNGQLANSSITIGSTAVSLGNTATSISGLTSLSTTSAVITSALSAVSLNTSSFAGYRNRVINGDMEINQRYGSSSISCPLNSVTFTTDRFYVYTGSTGAGLTAQRIATTSLGFRFALQLTGAAGNTIGLVGTKLSPSSCADLVGGVVSISIAAASSTGATLNIALYYANSSGNFTSKTSFYSTSQVLTSSLTRYVFTTGTVPANGANGLCLEVSINNFTSGTAQFTGIQIEPGPLSTPFEQRSSCLETLLCQQFYQSIPITAIAGKATSTTEVTVPIPLATIMRVTPTATSASVTSIYKYEGTPVTLTSPTFTVVSGLNNSSVIMMKVGNITVSANNTYVVEWSTLVFDSEFA